MRLKPGSQGIVFDLQRGSFVDGPGLRTTVFLKGCPLRCRWCHNPESQRFAPEVVDRGTPSERRVGTRMSVGGVMAVVERDRAFYEHSGGGMTLSGGEPMAQPDFTAALLSAAHTLGVHTCLDTSGHAPWDQLRRTLPVTDLYLFDYKATGDGVHRELTGVDPTEVLGNLRRLTDAGADVRLRCPLVPGVNDGDEHLRTIARLAEELPVRGVDLLPYHALGRGKRRDAPVYPEPTADDRARWEELTGFPVTS